MSRCPVALEGAQAGSAGGMASPPARGHRAPTSSDGRGFTWVLGAADPAWDGAEEAGSRCREFINSRARYFSFNYHH